jgi:hypothetical protein
LPNTFGRTDISKYDEAKAAEKIAFTAWNAIGNHDKYATCVELTPAEAKMYAGAKKVWQKAEDALHAAIVAECEEEDRKALTKIDAFRRGNILDVPGYGCNGQGETR